MHCGKFGEIRQGHICGWGDYGVTHQPKAVSSSDRLAAIAELAGAAPTLPQPAFNEPKSKRETVRNDRVNQEALAGPQISSGSRIRKPKGKGLCGK
jgi:hypothetical protein